MKKALKTRSYSFIKPRLKPIISLFSTIWLCLIGFIFIASIMVNIMIKILSYNLDNRTVSYNEKYADYTNRIEIIRQNSELLKAEKRTIDEVFATNQAIKRSIRNIFDIVPDTITLDYTKLDKNSLEIKGKTPSKEALLLLMEAPLKSIFTKTHTSFYQLPNGWLNFTIISKSEDEQ